MDDTGSWFPIPDESELPGDLQKLFAKARERLGFVPNVFRVYAFRPQRLSAWFSHFRQLHEPSEHLGAADREMIAVVVSAANGCLYCLVAHGAALRTELDDPVLGERISYDWRRAGLDERRTAICAYAEKLTLRPREVTRQDLQTLLDANLTLEEAWTWPRSPPCTTSPTGWRWPRTCCPTRSTAARPVRADRPN